MTVLSPIGLHVRTGPSRSAKVIGSAGQGAVLQLLAYTSQHGGWYKVLGTTLTGWISADPAYSTRGQFSSFSSPAFGVLYPQGWTQAGRPRTGVTFRSPSPTEKVIIQTAPSLAKLPAAAQGAGVSQSSSRIFVACGVTGYFVTYTTSTPHRYLAGIALLLDAHHALGLRATYTSPSQLRTVLDFVNSLSFPFAVCIGGAPNDDRRSHQGLHHDDSGRQQDRPQKALGREPRSSCPAPPAEELRARALPELLGRLNSGCSGRWALPPAGLAPTTTLAHQHFHAGMDCSFLGLTEPGSVPEMWPAIANKTGEVPACCAAGARPRPGTAASRLARLTKRARRAAQGAGQAWALGGAGGEAILGVQLTIIERLVRRATSSPCVVTTRTSRATYLRSSR